MDSRHALAIGRSQQDGNTVCCHDRHSLARVAGEQSIGLRRGHPQTAFEPGDRISVDLLGSKRPVGCDRASGSKPMGHLNGLKNGVA